MEYMPCGIFLVVAAKSSAFRPNSHLGESRRWRYSSTGAATVLNKSFEATDLEHCDRFALMESGVKPKGMVDRDCRRYPK